MTIYTWRQVPLPLASSMFIWLGYRVIGQYPMQMSVTVRGIMSLLPAMGQPLSCTLTALLLNAFDWV